MENAYSIVERHAEVAGQLVKRPDLVDALRCFVTRRYYLYGRCWRFNLESAQSRAKLAIRWHFENVYSRFLRRNSFPAGETRVVSNAYLNINKVLGNQHGITAYWPFWQPLHKRNMFYDSPLAKLAWEIIRAINYGPVPDLFTDSFFEKLDEYKVRLTDKIVACDFRGLFVPADMGVFENLAIQAFKAAKRPSFLCTHGLPGLELPIDGKRTDYLLVYGDANQRMFVKWGYDPNRIIVTGHPSYCGLPPQSLRNSLENVLVLGRASNGAMFSHEPLCVDNRVETVEYLLWIQKVLMKLGVKSARLRPHPGENSAWYREHVSSSFYRIDQASISNSLKEATVVIGPTSSVLFDALFAGVNYVVAEPNLSRGWHRIVPLIPPFDGSVAEVPVAFFEEQLEEILRKKKKVDISVCHDYIKSPFNLSAVIPHLQKS